MSEIRVMWFKKSCENTVSAQFKLVKNVVDTNTKKRVDTCCKGIWWDSIRNTFWYIKKTH
jgi:hypothetical protein